MYKIYTYEMIATAYTSVKNLNQQIVNKSTKFNPKELTRYAIVLIALVCIVCIAGVYSSVLFLFFCSYDLCDAILHKLVQVHLNITKKPIVRNGEVCRKD